MIQPGTAVWFARHESRLAWRDWLSMMTAGKRERRRQVAIGFVVVRRLYACGRLLRRRPFRLGGARQAPTGRDQRDAVAVVAVDGLAGHGVDDAGVLCALRSRSHPGVAGRRAGDLRGAHRDRGASGCGHGAAAGRAVHRHADCARRLALARRLRRDPRHGCGRDRGRSGADGGAVSRPRPEAHAPGGAGGRRGDRRRLRDRAAGRRHSLLRDYVADRPAAVGRGAGADACCGQRVVVAGARGRRRRHARWPVC